MTNLPQPTEPQWTPNWGQAGRFVRPLYDTYGFARLPELVQALFSVPDAPVVGELLGPLAGEYEQVVLVLVDAFGWRFVERYRDDFPFLQRFFREGQVTRLTSQFPSTTAAHLTALHTGLEVGQSGVYEWFMYEPTLDAVIGSLLYSYAGDDATNRLAGSPLTPQMLYPQADHYQRLAEAGVRSVLFGDAAYTPSAFSSVVMQGAKVVPTGTFEDAVRAAGDLLAGARAGQRGFTFLYCGDVDYAGHQRGCESAAFSRAAARCFQQLELLQPALGRSKQRTLLLFTADHGMLDVDPARTLALDWAMPEIFRWLEPTRSGGYKVPAGAPRDFFLHIRPEYLDEAQQRLSTRLAGIAEVHPVADLIAQGFFGSHPPSEVFLSRVGNLVILPYSGESVWWWGGGRFRNKLTGHHGGLTPEEMQTQVLAFAIG
ncbi:MAG: phosphodiesterase [Chloroflexi bacterium]|nr:MAG: phosphodiesterase [Chloroflexota bacterium]